MLKESNITLVVACNDHFAVMMGALIQSIIQNHKNDQQIDLYIVNDNISIKNQDRINTSAGNSSLKITWLDSKIIFQNIHLPVDNSSFPRTVYMRLFIPSFLPIEVKKAIYLDVDMIACEDISKLWEIDLGDFPAAAVRDRSDVVSSEWGGLPNYIELGMHPNTPYFNTGLIMFNMDIWRMEGISQRIIDEVEKNIQYAGFPDQYGLNAILADRCLELDFRWNCFSMLNEKKPYIIHFIGNKPIYSSYSENRQYGEEFFKYVKLSAWNNFRPYSGYWRYINKALNKLKNKMYKFN